MNSGLLICWWLKNLVSAEGSYEDGATSIEWTVRMLFPEKEIAEMKVLRV